MATFVSDFVLERLTEWGSHRIYGYPGDGINGLLGALDRADGDPEFIQARHEEMAAFISRRCSGWPRAAKSRAGPVRRCKRRLQGPGGCSTARSSRAERSSRRSVACAR